MRFITVLTFIVAVVVGLVRTNNTFPTQGPTTILKWFFFAAVMTALLSLLMHVVPSRRKPDVPADAWRGHGPPGIGGSERGR